MSKPAPVVKHGGDVDFGGQKDNRQGEEGAGGASDVRLNKSDSKNRFNGSGGTHRVISPGSVKGSNP